MRQVTKDEFYAFLKSDPRDIMPTTELPNKTLWRDRNRVLVGESFPGWRNPCEPVSYWLKDGEQ